MSKAQEAQQFLDDLEHLAPPVAAGGAKAKPTAAKPAEAAEALAFLDEITQKSAEPTPRTAGSALLERPGSRAGTPTLRKSTERVRMGAPAPLLPSGGASPAPSPSRAQGPSAAAAAAAGGTPAATPPPAPPADPGAEPAPAGGGWGWGSIGSVWGTASAAIQQARTVVDEQVKQVQQNEQAKKWAGGALEYAKSAQTYAKNAQEYAKSAQEYAKQTQLEKLGQDFKRVGLSTLTEILNVVAPPISEHEVLQVWLSHDMIGYDGVETVVYRALSRIMEQVETGDLIVNRGDSIKPKEKEDAKRDMNAVEGYDAALKLAKAELTELMKREAVDSPDVKPLPAEVPITYSHIYLRVQPFIETGPPGSSGAPAQDTLQFILQLVDPGHKLVHTTRTQAVPAAWVDAWDKFTWIEDSVVEALRVGVEVLGQEYVAARMAWIGGTEVVGADKSGEDESEEESEEGEEAEKPESQTKAPQVKVQPAK